MTSFEQAPCQRLPTITCAVAFQFVRRRRVTKLVQAPEPRAREAPAQAPRHARALDRCVLTPLAPRLPAGALVDSGTRPMQQVKCHSEHQACHAENKGRDQHLSRPRISAQMTGGCPPAARPHFLGPCLFCTDRMLTYP